MNETPGASIAAIGGVGGAAEIGGITSVGVATIDIAPIGEFFPSPTPFNEFATPTQNFFEQPPLPFSGLNPDFAGGSSMSQMEVLVPPSLSDPWEGFDPVTAAQEFLHIETFPVVDLWNEPAENSEIPEKQLAFDFFLPIEKKEVFDKVPEEEMVKEVKEFSEPEQTVSMLAETEIFFTENAVTTFSFDQQREEDATFALETVLPVLQEAGIPEPEAVIETVLIEKYPGHVGFIMGTKKQIGGGDENPIHAIEDEKAQAKRKGMLDNLSEAIIESENDRELIEARKVADRFSSMTNGQLPENKSEPLKFSPKKDGSLVAIAHEVAELGVVTDKVLREKAHQCIEDMPAVTFQETGGKPVETKDVLLVYGENPLTPQKPFGPEPTVIYQRTSVLDSTKN